MQITITDVPPFDGTYELDLAVPFNGRELHLIKELAGVRLGEIPAALDADDYDVLIAITAITLTRNGKLQKAATLKAAQDVLMEAPAGSITADFTETVEDDADPPAETPSAPGSELGGSESSTSSSADLNGTGDDRLETIPVSTGAPG